MFVHFDVIICPNTYFVEYCSDGLEIYVKLLDSFINSSKYCPPLDICCCRIEANCSKTAATIATVKLKIELNANGKLKWLLCLYCHNSTFHWVLVLKIIGNQDILHLMAQANFVFMSLLSCQFRYQSIHKAILIFSSSCIFLVTFQWFCNSAKTGKLNNILTKYYLYNYR